MRRMLALLALAAATLAVAGCVASGGMPQVWGPVASAEHAALAVETSQLGAPGVRVDRAQAPCTCWLVVLDDSASPSVLASVALAPGSDGPLEVPLGGYGGEVVTVVMVADSGRSGALEFDPARPDRSLDKPVFVDGRMLAERVAVRRFGMPVMPSTAALLLPKLEIAPDGALHVASALAPGPSWIAVYADEGGRPGERIGLAAISGGEWFEFGVPLTEAPPAVVWVSLHADRGVAGEFEYDPAFRTLGADQPYSDSGVPIIIRADVASSAVQPPSVTPSGTPVPAGAMSTGSGM